MLVSLFKKQTPIALGLLALLSIVEGAFLAINTSGFVWFSISLWLKLVLYPLLLFGGGFFFNLIFHRYKVLNTNTFYPFLFYLVNVYTFVPSNMAFEALLLSFLFLLIYNKSLGFQEGGNNLLKIFDASFIVGVCTILHPSSIILLTVVYASILVFSSYTWREWIVPFTGVGLPIGFWWCYSYWFSGEFLFPFKDAFLNVQPIQYSPTTTAYFIITGAFLLFSIPHFFKYLNINIKKSSNGGLVTMLSGAIGLLSYFALYKAFSPISVMAFSLMFSVATLSFGNKKILDVFVLAQLVVLFLQFFV